MQPGLKYDRQPGLTYDSIAEDDKKDGFSIKINLRQIQNATTTQGEPFDKCVDEQANEENAEEDDEGFIFS